MCAGYEKARNAVAEFYSKPEAPLTSKVNCIFSYDVRKTELMI